MTTYYQYAFQLQDKLLGGTFGGPAIIGSGGMVMVCKAGLTSKATIYSDKALTALSNPAALVRGGRKFFTSETSVDLYIMCPDGQFVVLTGVYPDRVNEIPVDRYAPHQVMVIPVLGSDYTAAAENDTGFDLPAKAIMLPDVALQVTVAQAKTMDVGLLSSESGGDADGLMVGIAFTTAGIIPAKSASTAVRGALVGAGTLDRGFASDAQAAVSVSITPASATTTGAGRIILPYINLPTGAPTP